MHLCISRVPGFSTHRFRTNALLCVILLCKTLSVFFHQIQSILYMQIQLYSRSLGYEFSDMLPYIKMKSLYAAIPEVIGILLSASCLTQQDLTIAICSFLLFFSPALWNDIYSYVRNNYRWQKIARGEGIFVFLQKEECITSKWLLEWWHPQEYNFSSPELQIWHLWNLILSSCFFN